MNQMQTNVTYTCIAPDFENGFCKNWQVNEHTLAMSKADMNLLTVEIITFMVFVFVCKMIKKSI